MEPTIESLNFHHLRYFWVVAREGGILPASRRLRISHATISTQVRELEERLGAVLFDRRGRALELTEVGLAAFEYCERIFGLGQELIDTVAGGRTRARLRIGVTDDLPKLVVRQLLQPLLETSARPRLVIEEERHRTLLARLAVRDLDVVLSDAPTPNAFRIEATDHVLGHSGLAVLAARPLASRIRRGFPESLHGCPWLAPPAESQLGQILSGWLRQRELVPELIAEVADSALLKTLGGDGLGAFAVPRVAQAPAIATYRVEVVGLIPELRVGFYATTAGPETPRGWLQALLEHGRELFAAAE